MIGVLRFYVDICVWLCINTYVYIHASMHEYIYIYIYICICTYICIYIYIYMYVYIYTHTYDCIRAVPEQQLYLSNIQETWHALQLCVWWFTYKKNSAVLFMSCILFKLCTWLNLTYIRLNTHTYYEYIHCCNAHRYVTHLRTVIHIFDAFFHLRIRQNDWYYAIDVMPVCVHPIYIYIYIYTYIYIYIYTYIYVSARMLLWMPEWTCIYRVYSVCMYLPYISTHALVGPAACIHRHIHAYTFICIYRISEHTHLWVLLHAYTGTYMPTHSYTG